MSATATEDGKATDCTASTSTNVSTPASVTPTLHALTTWALTIANATTGGTATGRFALITMNVNLTPTYAKKIPFVSIWTKATNATAMTATH